MTNAHPTIISSQVGNWDTPQMGTDSWANQHLGITCGTQNNFFSFVQNSFCWIFVVFLVHFMGSKSSYKYWSSIPYNLQNLSRRKFWYLYLHISISIISSPSVESSNESNSIKSCKVDQTCIDSSIQNIDLSSTNISLMFVIDSVLIKPVIDCWDKINVISEVSWPRSCGEELSFLGH